MYENLITEVSQNPTLQPFLPFLFVLAIVYGLLSIVNIFKSKPVNVVISLVFAFFAAGYSPFVNFFFLNFGLILWSFVILFFIAFIMEAIGLRGRKKVPHGKENLAMVIVTIIIILFAAAGFAFIEDLDVPYVGTDNFLMILGLVLLVVIIYYAYEAGHPQSIAKAASQYGIGDK